MDLNISEQKLEDEENILANGHTFQQLLQYPAEKYQIISVLTIYSFKYIILN